MTTNPTPCSFPPCDVGPGEPCDRHECEWAHAEGEHELCGTECSVVAPPLASERETAIGEQITFALSRAGAFCGECGFEPGDTGCPDCQRCYERYVAAVLPIVRAAVAAENARLLSERHETNAAVADRDVALKAAETESKRDTDEVDRLTRLLGERDGELERLRGRAEAAGDYYRRATEAEAENAELRKRLAKLETHAFEAEYQGESDAKRRLARCKRCSGTRFDAVHTGAGDR